ncbi:ankyrin repeat-containing domain protein [Nemania sp. FL0031]|nr:ankyrin repeat-containing domain protein [Nemania sp. FL0031]
MASVRSTLPTETDFQDIKIVETFLNQGNSPNTIITNDSRSAPLHLASKRENSEVVELLLKHGADPKFKDISGLTPLHYAAQEQDTVGHLLLEYLADPNIRDNSGSTPLHYAARGGNIAMVILLLEFNANTKSRMRPKIRLCTLQLQEQDPPELRLDRSS